MLAIVVIYNTEDSGGAVEFRFKKPTNKIPGKGGQRWYKNVGLGFKTPKEAIEGTTTILKAA